MLGNLKQGISLNGNNRESGYKGEIDINGKLQGTLPQFIYLKEKDEVNDVVRIGDYAFYNLLSLKEIIIPETIERIENSAFNLSGLIDVEIPNSALYINSYAFYNCPNLTNVKIAGSVKYMGEQAFAYCNNLRNIEIENGLERIGSRMFYSCNSLTSVNIPNSVNYISNQSFSSCYNLTEIKIDNTKDAISGSPWGATATNTTVTWLRENENT